MRPDWAHSRLARPSTVEHALMPSDSSRDRLAAALGDDAKNVVMERGYSLGFVGVHGQVRLVQFRLSKKGLALDAASESEPLPLASSVSTFPFTFAAILAIPSAFVGSHTTSDGSASVMK